MFVAAKLVGYLHTERAWIHNTYTFELRLYLESLESLKLKNDVNGWEFTLSTMQAWLESFLHNWKIFRTKKFINWLHFVGTVNGDGAMKILTQLHILLSPIIR